MEFKTLMLFPNQILLKLPSKEEVTKSGIIMIVDAVKDPTYGEIVHRGVIDEKYDNLLKIGYEAHFNEHVGKTITYKGEDFLLLNAAREVIYTIKK